VSAFAVPYAKAFFEAAPAGYDVERFLEGASAVSRAIEQNPSLRAFLATPAVARDAKRKTVAALAAAVGLDTFGQRFFDLVLQNHRILEADQILEAPRSLHDARRGIVPGRVTVAAPIGEPERAAIAAALAERVGATVQLSVDVDPKILAGFVARVASNVFDASAAAAIRRFREQGKGRTGA
jgi:F-type H+-transporting ATPase subunit delta